MYYIGFQPGHPCLWFIFDEAGRTVVKNLNSRLQAHQWLNAKRKLA